MPGTEASSLKATLNGYFTIAISFIAIWAALVVFVMYRGQELAFGFGTQLCMVAIAVFLGWHFGRPRYFGTALVVFTVAVALPYLGSYLSLRQLAAGPNGEVPEISFATPWFMFFLPSVLGVVTLWACRHITNR